MTIDILLADDHPVVRAGLRGVFESHDQFRVVGEAASGEDAIAAVRQYKPDVVLLDIRMPGLSGVETCRQIKQAVADCHVIMLTAYAEDQLVIAAFQAGASGYLLKRADIRDMFVLIQQVLDGEQADPLGVIQRLDDMREVDANQWGLPELTVRELEVLALLAQGLKNQEIGNKINLSQGTVRNYVSQIFRKIGVINRAEAAAYAVEHHIHEYVTIT